MTAINQHTVRPHAYAGDRGNLTHAIPMLPKRQPSFLPLLKVLGRIDRTTNVSLRAHAPVLRECCSAYDRGLVDSPFPPDFVGAAVAFERAVAGVVGIVRWIVLISEVFYYVVFDQGVCGPAVEAKVGVTVGRKSAGVVEQPVLRRISAVSLCARGFARRWRRLLTSLGPCSLCPRRSCRRLDWSSSGSRSQHFHSSK
jgi:hypothetical protein